MDMFQFYLYINIHFYISFIIFTKPFVGEVGISRLFGEFGFAAVPKEGVDEKFATLNLDHVLKADIERRTRVNNILLSTSSHLITLSGIVRELLRRMKLINRLFRIDFAQETGNRERQTRGGTKTEAGPEAK